MKISEEESGPFKGEIEPDKSRLGLARAGSARLGSVFFSKFIFTFLKLFFQKFFQTHKIGMNVVKVKFGSIKDVIAKDVLPFNSREEFQ